MFTHVVVFEVLYGDKWLRFSAVPQPQPVLWPDGLAKATMADGRKQIMNDTLQVQRMHSVDLELGDLK